MLLDLRVGNPEFLHELLNEETGLVPAIDHNYFHSTGLEDLKTTIRMLHRKYHNIQDIEDYSIIITNGATQALAGSLTYKAHYGLGLATTVSKPYFFLFRAIAQQAGLTFLEPSLEHSGSFNTAIISTFPNNPTGDFDNYSRASGIVDCSYYWPAYLTSQLPIVDIFEQSDSIFIFSLAKAIGMASTRIGWIITKNKELESFMLDYIDATTGGVSLYSQKQANRKLLNSYFLNKFELAQKELAKRWELINISSIGEYAEVLNQQGMFLWLRPNLKFKLLSIQGLTGNLFGDSTGTIRLNIGCSTEKFNELLRRLNEKH